jgi:hypothetical protein
VCVCVCVCVSVSEREERETERAHRPCTALDGSVPAEQHGSTPTCGKAWISFSMTDLLGSASCCDRFVNKIERCSLFTFLLSESRCRFKFSRALLTWTAAPGQAQNATAS